MGVDDIGHPVAPTSIPHLFDDQGHLTIAIDGLGRVLDELLASAGSIDAAA